jgi:hypothetical protein
MTTAWTNPTIVEQYAEPGAESVHIPWKTDELLAVTSPDSETLGLDGVLTHISRSPKYDLTNKTWFLRARGYNFTNLPTVISGIELRLTAKRAGRITDETVQLCSNGGLIGETRADLIVDPIKIYGGSSDMWSTPMINIDETFGIVIRFQSHPQWPHKDSAYIQSLELRIH